MTDDEGHGKSSSLVCRDCGSTESQWADEISNSRPFGTGFMIVICSKCGAPIGNPYGDTIRQYVGH